MFVTSIYTCSDPAVYVSVETCRVVRETRKDSLDHVWWEWGRGGERGGDRVLPVNLSFVISILSFTS